MDGERELGNKEGEEGNVDGDQVWRGLGVKMEIGGWRSGWEGISGD